MARIKIKDLDVDLEELKKRDPEILKKIHGGIRPSVSQTFYECSGGGIMPTFGYPGSTQWKC